jgi:pyridoxal phosphate enzyme (YggS family)
MPLTADDIQRNLNAVHGRMHEAAKQSGRSIDDIRLIAVSKYMPASYVQWALSAGQKCFGENTVLEALSKQGELNHPDIEWHFTGHLQSNKVKMIAGNIDWLHTLDSIKLATRLSTSALSNSYRQNVLLQVNIAGDPQKYGLSAAALPQFIEDILTADLAGIQLRGLMTIGRREATAAERQADFAALRELREDCIKRFELPRFSELSMGMSGDFEAAISEGSTMVRVGSALFGPRPTAVPESPYI